MPCSQHGRAASIYLPAQLHFRRAKAPQLPLRRAHKPQARVSLARTPPLSTGEASSRSANRTARHGFGNSYWVRQWARTPFSPRTAWWRIGLAVKGSLRRSAPWTAPGRSERMAVHEGKGGVRAVGREGGLPNVQYDKVCYRSYYEEIRGPGSSAAIAPTTTRSEGFPAILRRAGSNACFAADEFFSAQLSNPTRAAPMAAPWADFWLGATRKGSNCLRSRRAWPVASSKKQPGEVVTKNQALAALRRFFDVLVTRHAVALNPFQSVRGRKHSVIDGQTPELTIQQARDLLASLDTSHSWASEIGPFWAP